MRTQTVGRAAEQVVENAVGFSQCFRVTRTWISIVAAVGLTVSSGCKEAVKPVPPPSVDDQSPKQAQPRLPTIKVWLGAEELLTEMALTSRQQETGMMFRTNNLAENEGMIFPLPETRQTSFWMKNCFVPLSIAYIDPNGVIQEIHDLQPQNTNAVASASTNIRFALETSQGWFQRHNVRTGAVVRTERGSLMDTFFRRR